MRLTVLFAVLVALSTALNGWSGGFQTKSAELELIERYEQGDMLGAVDTFVGARRLRSTSEAFRREAERWVNERRTDDQGRRLEIVAAIGIELMSRSFNQEPYDYYASRSAVEWACERLRQRAPSEFERIFQMASIALLQGAGDYTMLSDEITSPALRPPARFHIRHAAERFPREPRFKLAAVLIRPEARMAATWEISPGHLILLDAGRIWASPAEASRELSATAAALTALIAEPTVMHEARLRRGILAFVRGFRDDAIGDLKAAAGSDDGFLRHLALTMLGHAAMGRHDSADAVSHFRQAVDAVPATSAVISLAGALTQFGQTGQAQEVLERWRTSPRADDPWRLYGQGDYRLVGRYLTELRALVRR